MTQLSKKSRKELVGLRDRYVEELLAIKIKIQKVEIALHGIKAIDKRCETCRSFVGKNPRTGQTVPNKRYCSVNNKFYSARHTCPKWGRR